MQRGTVKFFNPSEGKRFGFAKETNGKEIFFHFGDGTALKLGYNSSKDVLEPIFEDKSPVRDPKKGEEIVYRKGSGKKGPKAYPWAFATDYNKLVALANQISQPRYWSDPTLVGFKLRSTTGWGPTTYYAYFPDVPGAFNAGLYVKKFGHLLLYKQGKTVVTGRTVKWDRTASCLKIGEYLGQPEEPVFGIIPEDAQNGFWFWNGARWEKCEQVEVHATSVIITATHTETPAYYRFVGLRTESGMLVPNLNPLVTSQEFFSIRKVGEVTGLPVVKTAVRKDGWFTERERQDWCEPNLTKGIDSRFDLFLDRLNAAKVTRSRLVNGDYECLVTITIPGEVPYQVEYNRLCDCAMWIQKTPGKTYVAESKDDARLQELGKMVATSDWVIGSYEKKCMTDSQGKFYIDYTIGGYAVFCPHGRKVSIEVKQTEDEIMKIALVGLRRDNKKSCPFGCEVPSVIHPEMCRDFNAQINEMGVHEGMLPIWQIRCQIEKRREKISNVAYVNYIPGSGLVYRTLNNSKIPGILLVHGETSEFLPAPIEVVKTTTDLLDATGRAVGNAGWEMDLPGFYKVIGSINRSTHDIKEAGRLETVAQFY